MVGEDGQEMFDRPPHEAVIAEQLNNTIDGGGLRFDIFSPDTRHKGALYTSAQNIARQTYFRNREAARLLRSHPRPDVRRGRTVHLRHGPPALHARPTDRRCGVQLQPPHRPVPPVWAGRWTG